MATQGALATLDDATAIDQIANGRMLKQIAADYGVSKVAVYYRLSKHPDYSAAMSLQAHSFVQDAVQEVRECEEPDRLNIVRARADIALRYAKAHNEAYRDKQQIEHTGSIQLDVTVKTDISTLVNRARAVQHTQVPELAALSDDDADSITDV